jgi:hypothetical protein
MKSVISTLALLSSISAPALASSWAHFESKWMEDGLLRWHYSFGGDAIQSYGQVFLEAIRKHDNPFEGVPHGENWQAYQVDGVWYFDISEPPHRLITEKYFSPTVFGVADVTGENCCEQGIFDEEYCLRTGAINCH